MKDNTMAVRISIIAIMIVVLLIAIFYLPIYIDNKAFLSAQQAEQTADQDFEEAIDAYRIYLDQYPHGLHSETARVKIEVDLPKRIEAREWQSAESKNTAAAYESYLTKFPNGEWAKWARTRLPELQELDEWRDAQAQKTKEAYESYLKRFPRGKWAQEANMKIYKLKDLKEWKKAENQNSMAAYETYIRLFPNGSNKGQALARLAKFYQPIYGGEWSGTTSQGESIHFTVKYGCIYSGGIKYNSTYYGLGFDLSNVPIKEKRFYCSGKDHYCLSFGDVPRDINYVLNGRFLSKSEAAGQFIAAVNGGGPVDPLSFGTGEEIVKITWQAQKK